MSGRPNGSGTEESSRRGDVRHGGGTLPRQTVVLRTSLGWTILPVTIPTGWVTGANQLRIQIL